MFSPLEKASAKQEAVKTSDHLLMESGEDVTKDLTGGKFKAAASSLNTKTCLLVCTQAMCQNDIKRRK